MFNIGSGEIMLIAVAALLVLGPSRLPEFARGIGKFIREFRRQTDDVRNVVEREFYRMDEQLNEAPIELKQPEGNVSSLDAVEPPAALPTGPTEPSQALAGAPSGEPIDPKPES